MESQANLILPRIATLPVSLSYSAPSYSKSAFILSPGSVHYRGFSSVQPNEGDSPSQLTPPVPSSIDLYAGGSYTFSTDTYISAPADDDGVTMTFGPATFSGIPSGSDVTVSIDGAGTKDYRRLPYSAPDGMIVTESFTDEPYGNGRAFSRLRRFLGLTFPETGVYITNATASAFGGSSGPNATLDFDIIPLGQPLPTVNQWTVSIVQPNNTTNQPFYTFPIGSDSRGPGTASSIASGGLHVNLPWNGRDSQNQPVSGDFTWVMATNVTSSTSGPGGAGTASLRLNQIQKSLKINASANPANYDPQSGTNTTLTFDLEAQGLGTSPNFEWNVSITDPLGSELFVFPKTQGAEGPGNVTAPSGISRRVSLVWNGLGSDGRPLPPDYQWTISATATRPVAGGGGDLQVARATVPNAHVNLEVFDITSGSPKLVARAIHDSIEQKKTLLTETCRGKQLKLKLSNFTPSSDAPVQVEIKGQRSSLLITKTMTKEGNDYVATVQASSIASPTPNSVFCHDAGSAVDSDALRSHFKAEAKNGYTQPGADPALVSATQLPILPSPTDEFAQDRTEITVNNLRAAGYEVVQARFTAGQQVLDARFRLRKTASVRYYSGHGWHGANGLAGVVKPGKGKQALLYGGPHTLFQRGTTTPNQDYLPVEPDEIASSDDFIGMKVWITAGCSVLDIFDLNGNYKLPHQFTNGWQDGEEWFNLAGGKNKVALCGYNYEGPPDESGSPTKIANTLFDLLGASSQQYEQWPSAWMRSNIQHDSIDSACAIDLDGKYHYIHFEETSVPASRSPLHPFTPRYYIHHKRRSWRTLDYSIWGGKGFTLAQVDAMRPSLRLYSKVAAYLPDQGYNSSDP